MTATDKTTIGLTEEGGRVLEKLKAVGLFKEEKDIAMLAMSLAIRSGAPAGSAEKVDTKWNIGSFDPDLKLLIRALYPDSETPYRTLEFLIDRGLRLLGDLLAAKGTLSVADMLGSIGDNAVTPR